MSLIISLAVAIAFSAICARPLQRVPWLFYLLSLLVCGAGIYLTYNPLPYELVRSAVFAVQKGQLGFSFFVVVMFIGVFGHDSAIRRYLNPVRAELSIMAAFLMISHFVPYLINYLSLTAHLASLRPGIAASLMIALALLVLLALLTVTSFNAVKKRMEAHTWKTVQRLAYVFFGLTFFHMLGYLLTPALSGSGKAVFGVIAYTAIFLLYAVLRVRKAWADNRTDRAEAL